MSSNAGTSACLPGIDLLDQFLFVMIMTVNKPAKATPKKQEQHDRVAFLLSQVGSRSSQEFARLLEPLGLVPPDAGILHFIAQSKGISQQGLAQGLNMHASRLVALIDDLESRGLVVREAHASDRRLYSLALTAKGEEILHRLRAVAEEHNRQMCTALTRSETAALHSLLSKIADQQGLRAGVHPGYRTLAKKPGSRPRRSAEKPATD
jgi:DNA-binding MarR family transcriptional regulator